MAEALVNGRVLIDGRFVDGRAVIIDAGRISAIVDDVIFPSGIRTSSTSKADLLVPGFIDTQVNGGGDRLFNDDPSVETIAAIGAAHRRFGTTGFLPTLISDDRGEDRGSDRCRPARRSPPACPACSASTSRARSSTRAQKGIHDARKLRAIDAQEIESAHRPIGGTTVVTLAPERCQPKPFARWPRPE